MNSFKLNFKIIENVENNLLNLHHYSFFLFKLTHMKTFISLFLTLFCFKVSSQDKKIPIKYQVGFSYSINTSKNSTVDRNASSKQSTLQSGEKYNQSSNLFDTTSDFTIGVHLAKKLSIHTNIRVGVDYTKCYISEDRLEDYSFANYIDKRYIYYNRKLNFLDLPINWDIYLKKSKNEKMNLSCLMGVFPTFVLKSTNDIDYKNYKWDGQVWNNETFENKFNTKYNYSAVLLSVDLGLKLEYNVGKSISLNFSTMFRNRGNIKFKERYTSYMVNIGVGYNY